MLKILKRIHDLGFICAWKKLKHTIFPSPAALAICADFGTYEYLERYASVCDWNRSTWKPTEESKIIWTCWWQGVEKAPKLVQKCIERMKLFANGYEVRVVTETNVHDYIKIPEYIIQKHNKGIIPHAHFSDIVRLMLLRKYGGMWIDSTFWMTDVVPSAVTKSDLFFYHSSGNSEIIMINPFIVAKPHHPIIEDVLSLLLAYWGKEDKLVAYTIMPLFCTMALRKSTLNMHLWEQTPLLYSRLIDHLLPILNRPFNDEEYELVKSLSPIHKLTYKFDQYGIDINKKGTFYDVLINGNKPD